MSLSNAILGFLNYAPMTGYDIKKFMDDSVNFFWMAQFSQIYRELKALESKGHIRSEVQPSGKGPDESLPEIIYIIFLPNLKRRCCNGFMKIRTRRPVFGDRSQNIADAW